MVSEKIIEIAVNALNEKKAKNISAVHVGELTIIAEYFIIATATSQSHIKSLADTLEEKLEAEGFVANHTEGRATGWVLLDFNGVVIHIMSAEAREFYNLDRMWSDGDQIQLDDILKSAREED